MSSKSSLRLLAPFAFAALASCSRPAPPRVAAAPRATFDYPAARRGEDGDVLHGVRVADPYRWLETDTPETKAWFEAEDKRARRELAKLAGAKPMIAGLAPLFANPLPRLGKTRGNVSFLRQGPKLTMTRLSSIDVADPPKAGRETPPGSVVFDESEHAADGAVTRWFLSRDGAYVLLEQGKNGLDRRSAVLVETKTARVMERLVGFEGSEVAWAKDGFFYGYTPPDAPHADRFGQRDVRFHAVGTEQAKDRVVVPPSNDRNASDAMNPIDVTKDGKRLLVQTSGSWQRSTYAIIELTKSDWISTDLSPPGTEIESAIVVDSLVLTLVRNPDGTRSIVRNDGAIGARLALVPPELLGLDAEGPYAVLTYAAKPGERDFVRREFYDGAWKKLSTLETPRGMKDSLFSAGPDVPGFVLTREGLGVPPSRFDFDPRTGARKPLEESKVDWPKDDFQLDTLEATSKDGTKIPVTVLRRKDTPVDGTAALALYGYGGFRGSAEQVFYPGWMIWAREKGRVFAQCHMRGGVEFGLAWHRAGMLTNRQKTLEDFHACLEALHGAKYATPARTVTQGWSHGGMMVTAAALQRPDLQRVVIAQAPLEDMVRYVHFGRGGISEYGDPENPAELEALLGFSPYHNVKPGLAYPAFFITSPSADERVHPMHPRKITAALQNASKGGEVLLKVLWDAGHHGGAKDDANEVMAEAWAFALSKMDPR